ncbi:hypothetical protein [Desertibacillus haloalkaliphilus]|uniref:hypothetical protein n=1 Tax=Desertibacillus haloalkaliphilus TaxID=1328930 RepID=UPI001C25F279|nr:hypothetical protein [Desertibacillus haloalkaliphilus]MBU8906221.1 hypothetical protein [Desertibacillus haloalkaliphilus]
MKKVYYLLILVVFVLGLSACNNNSAKETYIDTYQDLLDANSYEVTSSFSLNIQADPMPDDQDVQMVLELLNNAEITAESRVDMEQGISEVILSLQTNQGPLSFNLDIPIHIDDNNEQLYIKTDVLNDVMELFPVMPLPADFSFEKEFIELDVYSDLDNEDQKMLEQQYRKEMNSLFDQLPEENFQENDNVFELNIEGDQIKQLLVTLIESTIEHSGEILDPADKQELEHVIEQITFTTFTIQSKIENGQLQNEKVSFGLEAEEGHEKVNIDISVINSYSKINEAIDFALEPTEENTMTQRELEQLISEMMMEMMFHPY